MAVPPFVCQCGEQPGFLVRDEDSRPGVIQFRPAYQRYGVFKVKTPVPPGNVQGRAQQIEFPADGGAGNRLHPFVPVGCDVPGLKFGEAELADPMPLQGGKSDPLGLVPPVFPADFLPVAAEDVGERGAFRFAAVNEDAAFEFRFGEPRPFLGIGSGDEGAGEGGEPLALDAGLVLGAAFSDGCHRSSERTMAGQVRWRWLEC